jgi:hypothetical protein
MSIQESTIKRLFGMSRNRCAMPNCPSPLIIGDTVVGEICHIRAKRKGGPRYDPTLKLEKKHTFDNLLLLCGTCHKIVDSKPNEYTCEHLEALKLRHERETPHPLDLSPDDVKKSLRILQTHIVKTSRAGRSRVFICGVEGVFASATENGVSIAIGGSNSGPINIKTGSTPRMRQSPANRIGADANMKNCIDYLCDLYARYTISIEPDEQTRRAKIGTQIKSRFRLRTRSRNDLAVGRFSELVDYLHDKLARTPIGRKHLRNGTRFCRSFDEYRFGAV